MPNIELGSEVGRVRNWSRVVSTGKRDIPVSRETVYVSGHFPDFGKLIDGQTGPETELTAHFVDGIPVIAYEEELATGKLISTKFTIPGHHDFGSRGRLTKIDDGTKDGVPVTVLIDTRAQTVAEKRDAHWLNWYAVGQRKIDHLGNSIRTEKASNTELPREGTIYARDEGEITAEIPNVVGVAVGK